jgi:4-amino-4-deoxy-L-arabinose transferase-like glycosyltransferase
LLGASADAPGKLGGYTARGPFIAIVVFTTIYPLPGGTSMNPTTTTKPWYASTGVWGALVTLASSLLALLKFELDPQLLDDVREWVLALATLIGGGVALWGRVRATRRIGSRAPDSRTLCTLFVLTLLATSAGCALLTTPAGPYVAADRATYDAVAPEYRAYVANDPALDAEQRARRERTVEVWRLRLEDAETSAAPAQP